jgi:glycosyltransferase involved in cell wall biosynthesis
MTITLLTSDYFPNVGGMAVHVHELSRALAALGHKVHLVNPVYGTGEDKVESFDGVTLHRLYIGHSTPRIKHLFYINKVRRYLLGLFKRERVDILHWHDLTPNCWTTATLRNRVPLVWTNHSSNYLEYYETEAGRRKIRRWLGHADAVIGPSLELHMKSIATGIPEDMLFYIPNGVDSGKFRPGMSFDVVDKDYGLDSAYPVILCPRRLEPKNGVEFFIRSIPIVRERFPNAQFLVAGGGFPEERARFEDMLRAFGQQKGVVFSGNVSNTVMPKFYALATIAVLPSLMEATSIAGLEAMACGLPLIGTTVGGIPEIISDGDSGLLVEPRDERALAGAMIRILEDQSLRTSLGREARRRVETEFAWSEIARRTCEVYDRVLAGRKA